MPDWSPILVALIALVGTLVAVGNIGSRTVLEYQKGLRYVDGRFAGVVGPGRYWAWRDRPTYVVIDLRSMDIAVPGQEVLTSDGIGLKISLAVRMRIVDPVAALHETSSYHSAIYTAAQVALRQQVALMTVDDVMQRRETIGPEVLRQTVARAHDIGIELEEVAVKDLMLPAATKRLFSQIVEARQQGLAALEKARGETAALRNLANAAQLLEDKPSLLQLRLLHQLEATSGHTVVVGLGGDGTLTPVRAREAKVRPAKAPADTASDPSPANR